VSRRYDSFLVRCWALDTPEPRIEVEHIQSGRRTHLASLALVAAWMSSSPAAAGAVAPAEGGGRSEE
jgi:hypothetical protein